MTVKLIFHSGECRYDDDTSLPYKLELSMRAPSFMAIAALFVMGGTEDVVARGDTCEELLEWMKKNALDDHPRLTRWKITGPNGFVRDHDCVSVAPPV